MPFTSFLEYVWLRTSAVEYGMISYRDQESIFNIRQAKCSDLIQRIGI